jgi:hypothetical protein
MCGTVQSEQIGKIGPSILTAPDGVAIMAESVNGPLDSLQNVRAGNNVSAILSVGLQNRSNYLEPVAQE